MREKNNRSDNYYAVAVAAVYCLCAAVGFTLRVSVLLQIAAPLVLSFLLTDVFLKMFDGRGVVSRGALISVIAFISLALILQLKLQLERGAEFREWQFIFYFDKPMCVGFMWVGIAAAANVYYILYRHIFIPNAEQRSLKAAFNFFYVALLVYSFVLMRSFGSTPDADINLIPFSTINGYIERYNDIPYEVFMMAAGNLFYFSPLGFCMMLSAAKSRNRLQKFAKLFVLPIVLIATIEYSQYIFRSGYCEIDDFLMNLFGFWLGAIAAEIYQKIVLRLLEEHKS